MLNFKNFYKKINEEFDEIMLNNSIKKDYDAPEVYAFFFDFNYNIYFGESIVHTKLAKQICYHNNFDCQEDFELDNFQINGRIWYNEKLITFWNVDEIDKNIIESILNVFNNKYYKDLKYEKLKIEIPVEKNLYNKLKNKYYSYCLEVNYCFTQIPITEYFNLRNNNFKIRNNDDYIKLHLMKSKEKSDKLKKLGYKSKHKSKNLTDAEYNHKSTRYKYTENKIYEDASMIILSKNEQIFDTDNYSYPISFDKNKFKTYIGENKTVHFDNFVTKSGKIISLNINDLGAEEWKKQEEKLSKKYKSIKDFDYIGRIWIKYKIISFWEYPDYNKFQKIISDINKYFKINMIKNNWKIEIYDDDKADYKLIPVKNYKSSDNIPEEIINLHLKKAKEKRKLLIKLGYKPKHKSKNLTDAEYNYKSTKYKFTENKN